MNHARRQLFGAPHRGHPAPAGNGVRLLLAAALSWGALVSVPTPATAAVLNHPAPLQARDATTMTGDAIPTAQIDNGVAWTVQIVGSTVYAGGSFANARPAGAAPGTNLVPRKNLLAFNLTTGALTSFAPNINGTVKALAASPDGSRLYVGGTFTAVNGQARTNIAAFSTATGALLDTFRPTAGGTGVFAIAASATTVYVGGELSVGNGVGRRNLMAFTTSGGLLSNWAPRTDWRVESMVLNPSGSKVVIAGRFYAVNGVVQRGMAALSPTDGSVQPWAATSVIKNGWNEDPYINKAGIWSLSTDGVSVFGAAWVYANNTVGNLEGAFSLNPETGAINWIEDCHGDHYGTYSDRTYVYVAGHPHDCESVGGFPQKDYAPTNMRYALAFTAAAKGTLWRTPRLDSRYTNWEGRPAPAMVGWFPEFTSGTYTGQGQAAWAMAGTGNYLVVGGEFPTVNGRTQAGLVRFARPAAQPAREAPRLAGSGWVPRLRSLGSGTVRVSLPANFDRDDLSLTYRVTRSGVSAPVHTTTLGSTFWSQPMLGFLDTGLSPGATYTYRVTASDGNGNTATSGSTSITVPGGTAPPYPNRVLADRASLYWRLGSGEGGSADVLGYDNGVNGAGVTNSSSSALGSGTGYRFSGTSGGQVGGSLRQVSPDAFSAEVWFRTTTSSGGRLFGFGTTNSGASGIADRHVYLSNTGQLTFGVLQDNLRKVITSAGSYRDGRWHQVVATESSAGASLYVDGALVRSDASIIKGQGYYGYWRIGGDTTAGWPNRGTSDYLAGDLDEFAVYPYALTAAQVQAHYAR